MTLLLGDALLVLGGVLLLVGIAGVVALETNSSSRERTLVVGCFIGSFAFIVLGAYLTYTAKVCQQIPVECRCVYERPPLER